MVGGDFEYVTHQKCLYRLAKGRPNLCLSVSAVYRRGCRDERVRVHIYGSLTLWPVTCEYILLPMCMHVMHAGLMSMGVIYDKVDKGSFLALPPHLRSDSGET